MSKSYWLHRISYHAELSYPLLKRNILSIGFSDFSDRSFIESTKKDNSYFAKTIKKEWDHLPTNRYSLWRFLFDMKKGDYVVVPSWGTFSVYEISDDNPLTTSELDIKQLKTWSDKPVFLDGKYLYTEIKKKEIIDLGFFRKVKLIEADIPRYEFADSRLTSRMKVRQLNVNIDDLKTNVDKALIDFKQNKPINLHSLIMESTVESTLRIIKNELNPDKFELLIKSYFERIGADDVYIPAKNEREKKGDADIVASFETIKTIIYVQAKFQDKITPSWAIEQIQNYKESKESMDDGYSRIGWVISTAESYSEEAYEEAKSNKIQLIDGKQFVKMLLNVGICKLDKLF